MVNLACTAIYVDGLRLRILWLVALRLCDWTEAREIACTLPSELMDAYRHNVRPFIHFIQSFISLILLLVDPNLSHFLIIFH